MVLGTEGRLFGCFEMVFRERLTIFEFGTSAVCQGELENGYKQFCMWEQRILSNSLEMED